MKRVILDPLPVAVNVIEAELARPPELRLDSEQAVRRILILKRLADRCEERHMQAVGRRSPARTAGFRAERSPRHKGLRYPVDPPTIGEIVAVMRAPLGLRLHGQNKPAVSSQCRGHTRPDRAAAPPPPVGPARR